MKLSIITINRNNAAGLARTLESTFESQPGFNGWEQIVVDGASTDDSLAVLNKWKGNPHLGWHVSEPDTGIYNAMNKGAAHARGDYLLFLNSGDTLLPNSLRRVFAESFDADLVVSNMDEVRRGKRTRYFSSAPERIDPVYFLFRTLPHQGTLVKRSLHEQLGGYDESLRFAADLKFFFRCFTERTPVVRWELSPFSVFYDDGISNRLGNHRAIIKEWKTIVKPFFGEFAASRAGFRIEGRPWIRDEVADAACRDASLARFLRYSSSLAFFLWKIPPIKFLLKTAKKLISCPVRLVAKRKETM